MGYKQYYINLKSSLILCSIQINLKNGGNCSDFIVTKNVKDFKNANAAVITPGEKVKLIG